MTRIATTLGSRLAAAAALFVIAAAAIAGCSGPSATPAAGAAPGGPTRPAVTSTRAVHLSANLCAGAATANASIHALTEALVLHEGRQQVARLLHTVVATYTALGSEAPGNLEAAIAALAEYYRSVEVKVSGGGQLALSDIEPAAHPGVSQAVRQVSRYFLAHCAQAAG